MKHSERAPYSRVSNETGTKAAVFITGSAESFVSQISSQMGKSSREKMLIRYG